MNNAAKRPFGVFSETSKNLAPFYFTCPCFLSSRSFSIDKFANVAYSTKCTGTRTSNSSGGKSFARAVFRDEIKMLIKLLFLDVGGYRIFDMMLWRENLF